MNVLITGGTGTISSGLVKESVNRGYNTYSITRGTRVARNVVGANYIYIDLFSMEDISDYLPPIHFNVVVECLVYDINQLKISLKHFSDICNQYVFISTAGIYNRIDRRIRENDDKGGEDWIYTKNKIECEKYLMDYSEKTGLKYTIVRPTVTYGDYRVPFPVATRNPGWTFFQRLIDGIPMIAGDNVKFSVMHIDDFAHAVVALFMNDKAINEDFHIASIENEIFWDDVIRISADILNVTPKIIHIPSDVYRKVFPSIYEEMAFHKNTSQLFDDTKLFNATGIRASIRLSDGLKMIINNMKDEYIKQKYVVDDYWNCSCNACIYYSYKRRLLNEDEIRVVLEDCYEYLGLFKRDYYRNMCSLKFDSVKSKARVISQLFDVKK